MDMTKVTAITTEDDFSVDFTLHNFSVTMLTEFAEKIVKPYYSGNMKYAVKDLIRKTIREEQLTLRHVEI
jgi:hypothetical protein